MTNLAKIDPEIALELEAEKKRQISTVNLIASENYTAPVVLEAMASVLTDKYAEGYPGKRYYAGCQHADKIEALAQERIKQLFNAEHANVQPHAGSQANMAVYAALLQPGDTVLGMSLAEGGHLTHGHKVNFSGKWYKSVQYTLNRETELLDYDQIAALAHEHKPKLIIAGASAYSRIIDFKKFKEIADQVGAYFLADCAHIAGLIVAGLHPQPFPYADFVTFTTHKTLRGPRGGVILCKKEHAQAIDRAVFPGLQGGPLMNNIAAKAVAFKLAQQPEFRIYQQQVINNAQAMANEFKRLGYRIVSGGTDNHMFIVDLIAKGIDGTQTQELLEVAGITVSKSCIPFDPNPPSKPSGIRIGTPAVTSRGMKEDQVREIVRVIDDVICASKNLAPYKETLQSATI